MKKYLAELIGTAVLVICGCGTAAVTGCNGEANGSYVLTALAFGLVIVAMAYSIGNVSGCHINPAVSLAVFINKGMDSKDFLGYVVAQCVGALVGAGILVAVMGTGNGLGTNGMYDGSIGKTLLIEIVLTFIFVLCIMGVTSKPEFSNVAGLVIGGALTLVHLLGIYFTGTSVNPARSLGPAILMGGEALSAVWLFIVGPLIGGALAAVCYRAISEG